MLKRFALLAFVFSAPLFASDGTDEQVRLFVHMQRGESSGFTAWLVAPDTTARPARIYFEAGYLIRRNDSWIELLGGAFIYAARALEPAIDLRFVHRRPGRYSAGAQTFFDLKTHRSLLQLQLAADLPVPRFQLGLESETTHGAGRTIFGIGPRLTFTPVKHVTFALGYEFRPATTNFVRSYSGVSW